MIKAVLLDLDNTLAENPGDLFAQEYLNLMDDFFRHRWNLQGCAAVYRKGLQELTNARDFETPNDTVILETISAAVGHPVDAVRDAYEAFYAGIYQTLRRCVRPVAIVPPLVQTLHDRGYAVVIATNPVYPASAIMQRLAWAGLPDQEEAYALVTHSDTMHFVKPDPAYFAEILARVGVEPDEALMVGDRFEYDIAPAAAVGLHTFHIHDGADGAQGLNHSGGIARFDGLVNDGWLDTLNSVPLKPEMIAPQLRGNIGALFGMLAEVKTHFWMQQPDPNEWSIMQIVCHLRDSETRVQRPRLERILAEDNPFLVSPDAPPGPQAPPCDSDGYRVARGFAIARQETIRFLAGIAADAWQRPARHSIFGPTSLLEMAHFTAQHDRMHLNQLCQTLGRCE